ncbi:2-dehydro-3-deoxyphosphogluconate aldolase / (4S)-4-hydroxy-2-oxoglutarate aldolase [Modestobacter sp. DSM 44400]|uniref:bifunctional 4-hydroxy-2-oxoglutarate aldolase/2-dehydro-3-deoxy-phosphogluconate aldolase n=1 Tax=Modestobacter sp. DSM 44400 TaxID=1550230 RepID=UPI000896A4BF|nr:bifunctional 4-hydroxy-2-oxoglutarate aldolase/2-dehydro-3-deoxy-phosphogluconate aldolase [Modestobacter sp. DSM 44400]SDY11719.1 2-dehydro-3-deoxyphosphogluconate aldolase / (4S)-4-hydroxy-2-oxoglutarate aldolase [Modestobacter sp. DSM 44400]
MNDVLTTFARSRILAVIRGADVGEALRRASAAADRGIRAVGITFTVPDAVQAVRDLTADRGLDLLVGVGTVTSPEQAEAAASAGAGFLVSPGCDDVVTAAMVATGLPAVVGCLTAGEVMRAQRLGCAAVKLFPAVQLGPAGLRALREPFPDLAAIPTGGLRRDDVQAWLDAGALAVGLGSALFAGPAGRPR